MDDTSQSYTTQIFKECEEVTLPADPSARAGYTFGGWYSIPYVNTPEVYETYKKLKLRTCK